MLLSKIVIVRVIYHGGVKKKRAREGEFRCPSIGYSASTHARTHATQAGTHVEYAERRDMVYESAIKPEDEAVIKR